LALRELKLILEKASPQPIILTFNFTKTMKFAPLKLYLLAPSVAVLLSALFFATSVEAAKVVLYENDFEAPKMQLSPDPVMQLLATPNNDVNVNYGEQGGAGHSKTAYGNGQFGQQQTVETLVLRSKFTKVSPAVDYVDPDGRAGQYAIGMFSAWPSAQDSDLLWLDFDAPADQHVFTVELDISPIQPSDGAGTNDVNTAAVMDLILSDRSSGQVLSTQRVNGLTAPMFTPLIGFTALQTSTRAPQLRFESHSMPLHQTTAPLTT
jgi:hypothetical protein